MSDRGFVRRHELLGIEKVCVDKAGIQHAYPEMYIDRTALHKFGRKQILHARESGNAEIARPLRQHAAQLLQICFRFVQAFFQSGVWRGFPACPVRKPCVMPRDEVCEKPPESLPIPLHGESGARSGMIDACAGGARHIPGVCFRNCIIGVIVMIRLVCGAMQILLKARVCFAQIMQKRGGGRPRG